MDISEFFNHKKFLIICFFLWTFRELFNDHSSFRLPATPYSQHCAASTQQGEPLAKRGPAAECGSRGRGRASTNSWQCATWDVAFVRTSCHSWSSWRAVRRCVGACGRWGGSWKRTVWGSSSKRGGGQTALVVVVLQTGCFGVRSCPQNNVGADSLLRMQRRHRRARRLLPARRGGLVSTAFYLIHLSFQIYFHINIIFFQHF